MLKMSLIKEKDAIKELCKQNNVHFSDEIMVYNLLNNGEQAGYVIFGVNKADYEMTIYKTVYDRKDVSVFDFIIKGVLGLGEQYLVLTVNFENKDDINELLRYKFIKSTDCLKVKLFETVNNCKSCKGH